MSYKLDFLMGVSAHIARQTVGILFLSIIYTNTPALNGWTYHQSLMLYGFALIPAGLDEFFLRNIWTLPNKYVRMGNLDRLLLRPINPLYAITVDGTNLHGFILSIYGIIVCVYSGIELNLVFTPMTFLWILVLIICATSIYFSITILMATFSFWFIDVMSSMVLIESLNQFLKYPLAIYPYALQILLTWIIPYAFTSYFPVEFILGGSLAAYAYITPVIALLLLFIASRFFVFGLKRYSSAGG